MRILVMANNFPWPGSGDGTFNLRHVLALRERGHDVRVLRVVPWAPPGRARWQRYRSLPDRYVVDDIPVQTLRVFLGPRNWGIETLRAQVKGAVARAVAEYRPDLIHVHGLLPAGLLALDAGLPYVLTAHGSETYRLPWSRPNLERLARGVVANASCCAAVSRFVASHVERLGARDVRVVFNGADEGVFGPRDRAAARARLGLHPERPTIAFAGHLETGKGVLELVRAARELTDLSPCLALAGTGSLEETIANALAGSGVDVRLLGFLEHERLADLMAACDVFVLPSHAEGLPTVLCEAMNAGRAIVATRVGGIPEIVRDGETGYVIEPRDERALAARMRELLGDAELRARFERNALAFAREHLTWAINARAYEAIYEEIIARRSDRTTREGDRTHPQTNTFAQP